MGVQDRVAGLGGGVVGHVVDREMRVEVFIMR